MILRDTEVPDVSKSKMIDFAFGGGEGGKNPQALGARSAITGT